MKVKKKVVEQTFWYDTLRKRETDSYFPEEQVLSCLIDLHLQRNIIKS